MQVVEDIDVGKIQSEGSFYKFSKGSLKDVLDVLVVDGNRCFRQIDLNVFLLDKYRNVVDKEVFLLFVKYFDFLCEEKNMDESILYRFRGCFR